MSGSTVTGLTGAEVQARRQNGQGNDVKLATSRSYGDIVKTNVFSPINLVLYAIGIGMILVGDFRSAIATSLPWCWSWPCGCCASPLTPGSNCWPS